MNRARLRVLVLMFTDALVISALWALLTLAWAGVTGVHAGVYIRTRGGFVLVFLAFNVIAGLYHGNPLYPGMALPPVAEFMRLSLTSLATGSVFFAYLSLYSRQSPMPPWIVMLTVGMNILVGQSARNLVRQLMWKFPATRIPVLLIGRREDAERLESVLRNNPHFGVEIAGTFLQTRDAVAFGRRHDVKHCISCQPLRVFRCAMQDLLSWFSDLSWMAEPRLFPIAMTTPVEISGFGGIEMSNQLRQKGMRAIKRLTEFLAAILACLVLLLPGLAIFLVLLCSGGLRHVFYSAERIGKCGRPFRIYKFRSMCVDADRRLAEILAGDPARRREWEATRKLKDDPRVTLFGRFLRKTSLDEIPQLLNVCRGEMALIGPRPVTDREKAYYGDYYDIVFQVKPGITGLWQVSGRSETDYATRVRLDTYYALNWGLWLDFWILLRTVVVVIRMRGAC